MPGYLLRRLLASLPSLLAVLGVTFLLLQIIPGDPAEARAAASERATDREAVEALRRQFGLERPVAIQALDWAGRCLRFDFGRSFSDDTLVDAKVARALWATAVLNAAALALILTLSLSTGSWLAGRRGTRADLWAGRALSALAAIPVAVGSLLLQRLLAVDLSWFPMQGSGPAGAVVAGWGLAFRPEYLCLPALAAAYGGAALYSRLVRRVLVGALEADYIMAARARGLPARLLYLRHTLRNASLPLISAGAALAPTLVSANVVVESVFGWPGAGRLAVDAVLRRDYPVVLALTWAGALFTLVCMLAADLLIGAVDPRVRLHRPRGAAA